ncbi:MAG: hypothetical protein DRJ98_08895 [Thermoprotei archaeon]|nr:MAG: hypothetical protein DRJ98_08895 [Thermoprotei archaeon]
MRLGASFIIAFTTLLIAAARRLSLGLEATANELAVYASYCLEIGVIPQIAPYVEYGRGGKGRDEEEN